MAPRLVPAQPGRNFIDAVAQVLSGLSKVVVTDELRRVLFPGGSPATPGELKRRFGDYVDEKAKGLDEAKVRRWSSDRGLRRAGTVLQRRPSPAPPRRPPHRSPARP